MSVHNLMEEVVILHLFHFLQLLTAPPVYSWSRYCYITEFVIVYGWDLHTGAMKGPLCKIFWTFFKRIKFLSHASQRYGLAICWSDSCDTDWLLLEMWKWKCLCLVAVWRQDPNPWLRGDTNTHIKRKTGATKGRALFLFLTSPFSF